VENLNLLTPKLIKLSKSCLGDAEKQAVLGVLDREYLGMGKEVELFESALSNFFGRPALAVANGTAALQLALQACGIGKGDEVLVQSLTYVATFQAISAVGAIPVPCDVDPHTLTIDLQDANKRITSKTRAIIPVHYAGGVGDLNGVYEFAKTNSLRIIEDAAHAFGTTYKERLIGSFGDIACFSFDGIKNITSGEGGCVVTSDPVILQKIKDARLLGVERDTENRYAGTRSWEFDVTEQGWRYHMSNIMAAIGLEQIKSFREKSEKRQKLATYYDSLLHESSRIEIFNKDYCLVVPHIYVIRILDLTNRRELQEKLLSFGIQTGIHYQPNHLLSFYRSSIRNINLSNTDKIYPEILTLPLHPDLSTNDVKYICDTLKLLVNEIQ
jgi:dTDP-4-amino-4,6-dideoxygalactose transaminase